MKERKNHSYDGPLKGPHNVHQLRGQRWRGKVRMPGGESEYSTDTTVRTRYPADVLPMSEVLKQIENPPPWEDRCPVLREPEPIEVKTVRNKYGEVVSREIRPIDSSHGAEERVE